MSNPLAVQDTLTALLFVRCHKDCGPIVSTSNKLRVTSQCVNSPCEGARYVWSLERLKDSIWQDVPDLANTYMTATISNTSNIVIKPNALQPDSRYRLHLHATSSSRTEGFCMVEFKTAGTPHGGHCESSVSEGVSLETEFIFECSGWQDETESLIYEFRLNDQQISYGPSRKTPPIVLPQGQPEEDYRISISVIIKNALDVSVVQALSVKVNCNIYVWINEHRAHDNLLL